MIRRIGVGWWRAATIVAACVLYAIATSGPAYQATTPSTMPEHEAVRKIYALLAFALLGFFLQNAQVPRVGGTSAVGIAIGCYSYAIELGQIGFGHSTETFAQHSFDVASGVVGGGGGAFASLVMTGAFTRARRREGAAIVVLALALLWAFGVTYAPLDAPARALRSGQVLEQR